MKNLAAFAAMSVVVIAGLVIAQPEPQPAGPAGQPPAAGGSATSGMGEKLLEGLRATPGCLGADAAQTQSGKNVIFAWFENKAAATAWYNSPTHSFMRMAMTAGGGDRGEPMAGIADDVAIMAVASLKMDPEHPLPGMRMPVSEISIELYTPLPGGLRYGGGFAPEGLKVEGRLNIGADGRPLAPAGAPVEGDAEPAAAKP